MSEVTSHVFIDGSTYIVFVDAVIEGKDASYVLHAEGSARKIYKLYLENKHKLHTDKYYMLRDKRFFGNHSEEVAVDEDGQTLYKYTGELD